MASSPILASPFFERRAGIGAALYYHGRFRGFAASAHAHDEAQLLVPLMGRMHLTAGERTLLLGPESAAWIPPGVPHGFTHVDGRLDFVAIEVDLTRYAGEAPGGLAIAHGAGPWLIGQVVARELAQAQGPLPRVLDGCLAPLLAFFARETGGAAEAGPPAEILRAVSLILDRYAEDLRVADLAREVAMSTRHFERCFKQALGQSPKRFVIGVRLGAAEALLRDSERPIGQIALEVGFATPSHFAAAFLAHAGCAPAAYRAAARATGEGGTGAR